MAEWDVDIEFHRCVAEMGYVYNIIVYRSVFPADWLESAELACGIVHGLCERYVRVKHFRQSGVEAFDKFFVDGAVVSKIVF